ncbi:MAG TPA: hypothetical protein VJV78_09290 [Polyangiales bacterium]|nr:hypothetical protein [Polyangiales bacterium]
MIEKLPAGLIDVRDRALLTLGFAGAFRRPSWSRSTQRTGARSKGGTSPSGASRLPWSAVAAAAKVKRKLVSDVGNAWCCSI